MTPTFTVGGRVGKRDVTVVKYVEHPGDKKGPAAEAPQP